MRGDVLIVFVLLALLTARPMSISFLIGNVGIWWLALSESTSIAQRGVSVRMETAVAYLLIGGALLVGSKILKARFVSSLIPASGRNAE